ncbi:Six-hairpin glycosidase-like protein [Aspergillus stella-maris]|uniref:Six-hairpin glycosidase-like protein n=1 Tax=Aspergillus stella-maris TaxID=1810926 RepID=UPI003CCDA98E
MKMASRNALRILSVLPILCILGLSQTVPSNAFRTRTTRQAEVQPRPYSALMADSVISRSQAIYDHEAGASGLLQVGVFQTALLDLLDSPSATYLEANWEGYLTESVESVIPVLGNASADTEDFPLDRLSVGRGLKYQYETTGNQTYWRTLDTLRESIELQHRNEYGGLWYYTYPNWSYLDGMFSLLSFYEIYTTSISTSNLTKNSPSTTLSLDFITHQLNLLYSHCHDNSTSLLVHGYDASRTAIWANKMTGASPYVWGRSLGWFMMGLVDFLEFTLSHSTSTLSFNHNREVLTWRERFISLCNALIQSIDPVSGGWWQVLNEPGQEGNYIESSGSAMFVYTLLKGVRLGLLPPTEKYTAVADRAYQTLIDDFVIENVDGSLSYNGTVSVCSLNSTASYEYYIHQPLVYDSVLGSAAFIRASVEYELYEDTL